MRHPQAERIGAVIPAVIRQLEHQRRALRTVQEEWGRLVGKRLAAHTRPVSLRHGRLVVHVERPGDGFALSYARVELVERLRASTQGKVEEMVIRPGEIKNALPR